MYVFLGHLIYYFAKLFPNTNLASLFYYGYSGIDMFFVISGFVIYHSTKDSRKTPAAFLIYLKKRVVRIYPIYWLLFILFLFVGDTLNVYSYKSIIDSFLLLPYHKPVFDVTWTLTFELYFYFLFGLVILNKQLKFIPVTIFLLSVLYLVLSPFTDVSSLPLHQLTGYHVIEFFLGVIAAIIFRKIPVGMAFVFLFAGTVCFFSRNILQHPILNYGFPSMLMILGVTKIESVYELKLPFLLLLIGDASYVIYLVHNPFLRDVFLHDLMASSHLTVFIFCTSCVLTLIISIIIHLYIEKPLIRFLNRKA